MTHQPKTRKNWYQSHIDGMRALAVLAVIINHLAHQVLPGGYLGVDVFFVISGYVITKSLQRNHTVQLKAFLLGFYARRVKRLLPALIVTVLLTLTLVRLVNPFPKVTTFTALSSVLASSNLFLFATASDYFGENIRLNPLMHTWSLSVEEQFYFLFPIAYWGYYKRLQVKIRPLVIAIITGLSLLAFVYYSEHDRTTAYYLTPFRVWEFLIGTIVAGSHPIRARLSDRWIQTVSAGALGFSFFIGESAPATATILATIATAGLLAADDATSIFYQVLNAPTLRYVGRISYSLYLWHWPIISLALWTVGVTVQTIPFICILIFACSAFSYHLIERPLNTRKWFTKNTRYILCGFALMSVSSALVMTGHRLNLPKFSGHKISTSPTHGFTPDTPPLSITNREIKNCMGEDISNDEDKARRALVQCSADKPEHNTQLIFFGDSHSMDMFGLAEHVYASGIANVSNFGQPGCRVPMLSKEKDFCRYPHTIISVLKDVKQPLRRHVVIRTNYNPKHLNGSLNRYMMDINKFAKTIIDQGYGVIYVAPSPKFPALRTGGLCSEQWYRPNWALSKACTRGVRVSRREEIGRTDQFRRALHTLEMKLSGFIVYDPFDVLCGLDADTCNSVQNQTPVYRDQTHITQAGSELLARDFIRFLRTRNLLGADDSK